MARGPNARLATGLGVVAAIMLSLSFAAVPFYNWFCRVTGYGGTTAIATAPAGPAHPETLLIRFDANVASDQPMEFRPVQRTLEVHLGQEALAFYEAYNPTDAPIAGQASFNVAPFSTGAYFDKIACFCFSLQVLAPGERVQMPVSFYVDPAMLDDIEAKDVRQITLSYTMYPAEVPPAEAAAADGAAILQAAAPPDPLTAPRALEN